MNHRTFLYTLALALPLSASADCNWEWLCNGEGLCKQMPICDTVYDKPGPAPASKPPQVPPLSIKPHKLSGVMAGLRCEHIMRKSRSGRWFWEEACYCVDAEKSADNTPPFANIVRCKAPWRDEMPVPPHPASPPASGRVVP